MWKEFREEDLLRSGGVIIHCPTQELHDECIGLLERYGCRWAGGSPLDLDLDSVEWRLYKERFCFRVHEKQVRRGTTSTYEDERYNLYQDYLYTVFCGLGNFMVDDHEIDLLLG